MSVMDFTNLINVDVDVFLKSDLITYQSVCHTSSNTVTEYRTH